MTESAEIERARPSKAAFVSLRRHHRNNPPPQAQPQSSAATKDHREVASRPSRTRTPRRVAPEPPSHYTMLRRENDVEDAKKQQQRLSASANGTSGKRNLRVDTGHAGGSSTPRTADSTPTPKPAVRNSQDLRSPGQRQTPLAKVVADTAAPLPDFITQTDRYGNASTPRSAAAVERARVEHPVGPKPNLHVTKDGTLTEEKEPEDDVCTETFMDSFRLMCCCLVSDEEVSGSDGEKEEKKSTVYRDKPRLLPSIHPDDHGKKCLVLDLDETLVHSSFRAVPAADFVIPVQIEDVVHFVYVMKRPGVDEFLVEMAKHYEIVIYTASLNKYADPLLDLLDPQKTIRSRLFRESCVYYEGNYVKDLSLLDRDLSQAIIIDNSPSSYIFHPENAIDCSSFIDDPADRELDQIAAFLKGIKDVKDVRGLTHKWREWPKVSIPEAR